MPGIYPMTRWFIPNDHMPMDANEQMSHANGGKVMDFLILGG
jgi:hypothetical protein